MSKDIKNLIKYILLFEAPIDVWKTKNQNITDEQRSQAEKYFADLTGKYNALLHPAAKDLTKLSFEQLETLHKVVEAAKNKNLKAPYIQWATNQFRQKHLNFQQMIEDYIPPLLSLQKNKDKFEPDFLNKLESIEQLNQNLNANVSSEEMAVSEEQYGKIAEKDGWILYMPHTTEASCEIGKTAGRRDTTWCTTRPDASNMFMQYSAQEDTNIVLFYVVKKGVNAEKNPFAKMSVGFIDNQPAFDEGDGGVSVNAKNENLTQDKFEKVVGKALADEFLRLMQKKSKSLRGVHPAKEEFRKLVQNPTAFKAKIESFSDDENGRELRKNFIYQALNDKELSPEALSLLAKDKDKNLRRNVAEHPKTPPEVLNLLAKDKNLHFHLAKNPNTPPEALKLLAKNKDQNILYFIAENPNTPPETLAVLAMDEDVFIRRDVAKNPNTSPKTLAVLAKDEDYGISSKAKENLRKKGLMEAIIVEKVLWKLLRKR